MFDAIKHITDGKFSFSKTAHRCIVRVTQSNWVKMQFSCFPVLPGSAETQGIWRGTVKCLLIAYFIGNISAKKYQNPFTCVKVIASQRRDVFWDAVYKYNIQSSPGIANTSRNWYVSICANEVKTSTWSCERQHHTSVTQRQHYSITTVTTVI